MTSEYIVSCVVDGTRFFLTGTGLATDIPRLAHRHCCYAQADREAAEQRASGAWSSRFAWSALRFVAGAVLI